MTSSTLRERRRHHHAARSAGAGLGWQAPPVAEEDLVEGVYEDLITERIRQRVDELVALRRARTAAVDAAEEPMLVGRHVGDVVAAALERLPEGHRVEVANRLLRVVASVTDASPAISALADGPALLLDVRSGALGDAVPVRPVLPLRRTDLLVNSRGEPQLAHEVAAEMASATSIDLLCAFLKWSGLKLVHDALSEARARGVPVRVLTTTYTGATDPRAVDELVRLGAEVKISYEVLRTRLHAKAWLFRRPRGLDTAYVGSSNLSRWALTDGLEWNVRLSRAENPAVIDKFASTFDAYWQSSDFEAYDPATDAARLREALREAGGAGRGGADPLWMAGLEPHPYPFQQEILDRLDAEREVHGRWRNLVVAATGTGKTVIAAFDLKRLRGHARLGPDPSLLFVAHRREILEQSRRVFAHVLGDPAFGEILVGGQEPVRWKHVFASVQSLASRGVDTLEPDRFDIVIVDEFHHAEAPTYVRILQHLRPKLLLGLTATPERADGLDVRRWFDGHTAATLRIWEALERDLLSPFHYFGSYDGVDVSGIEWKRGGYDTAGLDNLYTGNDARARVVLREIQDKVADPHTMRALGFCVSVAHAEFMARVTREAGIKAIALSGASPQDERAAALRDLREGRLQVIYSVDLFNEGLDVPAVDVVLLLRPTESATVFLQQLGRGLRHAEGKSHLTVLDFVGYQDRRFRFDLRFQALTGLARNRLVDAVEGGFPFLPSGCHVHLDRVASRVVLDNLRGQLKTDVKGLVADLQLAGDVGLDAFLKASDRPLSDVYRSARAFTPLRRLAGFDVEPAGPAEATLAKRLHRLASADDLERSQTWRTWLTAAEPPQVSSLPARQQRLAAMLFFTLWPGGGGFDSYAAGLATLWEEPALRREMADLLELVEDRISHVAISLPPPFADVPLWVHASYSREELLAGLGQATLQRKPNADMQGVRWVKHLDADVFTFTVRKSEKDYSPTTMYRDFPISPELVHWESQSTTSAQSPTGQRYLHHRQRGGHILLFGRLREKDEMGTAPFLFLGPATYVSHEGSNPISLTWKLDHRLPLEWFHEAGILAG
jgi:superfamily II DNA or RNA helicase/HKD family nuclease